MMKRYLVAGTLSFTIVGGAHALDEGAYRRTDGAVVLTLASDNSYTLRWGTDDSVLGLYQKAACLNSSNKNLTGTHMFYLAAGGSCCIDVEEMAGRFLLRNVAGSDTGLCSGGIFEPHIQSTPSDSSAPRTDSSSARD